MKKYIKQLVADLEAVTLARWRDCPPHHFEMGGPGPGLVPPVGYDGPKKGFGFEDKESSDDDPFLSQMDFDKEMEEIEAFVSGEGEHPMFDEFGFEKEQFPPVEKLKDDELDMLFQAMLRLWEAYNFSPYYPDDVPIRIIYPLMVEKMSEPVVFLDRGHFTIEFCHYDPKECPFGLDFCTCKEFLEKEEEED
jgi:hypothetical protein